MSHSALRIEGRFVDERLTPGHLRRVGALEAALQLHADGWTAPTGFARPRLDALTTPGKRESVVGPAELAAGGEHPTPPDAERCLQLVTDLVSPTAGLVIARALEGVWTTTNELGAQPGMFGLIHGDLHYENFLFHKGTARAIDFDDCGWGSISTTLGSRSGSWRIAPDGIERPARISISVGGLGLCTGDAIRIRQIIRNLIRNANRFAVSEIGVRAALTRDLTTVEIVNDGDPVPTGVIGKAVRSLC